MSSVIESLKKHILVDGFHVVVDPEASLGSWVVDKETGKKYLDCYSQFASQPLGWNYEPLKEQRAYIEQTCLHKLANSDMYSEVYRDFVEAFHSITLDFKHYFFIEGGALGIENALKAAFDWKCQVDPKHQANDGQDLDVVHLQEAFHGRTGYTLSLTNTGEMKTKWFPKFKWTRVPNPKIPSSPTSEMMMCYDETVSLDQMEKALKTGNVAAIIMETIQGEGGDNHFRPEFFQEVRKLADKYQAMMILDEVQCGMGLTGKWWAYEHMGIKPDMICFGKKSQVCGFCANERIESAPNNVFKQSGRINSTWGGNIVDMARAKVLIDIIKSYRLVDNARQVGDYFLKLLKEIKNPEISNVRGRGLMIAFDLPTTEERDLLVNKLHDNMLVLKSGDRSIRFRPPLSFTGENAEDATAFIVKALS